ncbi:MAG TPA: hypothetical protein VLT86_07295 [Vicinamibacterales bacterium]|nr:hypothetical protein [Vicinamibacterales bacterium]
MILYEWEASHAILRTVLVGPVSAEDIRQHLNAMAKAEMFGRAELIDARGTVGPAPSVSELWLLADHARRLMAGLGLGPRAMVVDDTFNYWVARVFANFLSGLMPIEVFRTEPAARQWLLSQSADCPEAQAAG